MPTPFGSLARLLLWSALVAASSATADGDRSALTLGEAAERSLRDSPELAVFSSQLRAADARALQARLHLNPELSFIVEDIFGSGDFSGSDQAQFTAELSRDFELGGKRASRVDAADRGIDLVTREYESARAELLANLSKRFFRVLAAQEILELAGQQVSMLERGLAALERRVSAGAASGVEATRSSVALARGRLAEEDARHELAVARVALASTWGEATPSFDRAAGSLASREEPERWEAVVARLDASPEIARQTSEVALRQAEIAVARARAIPNLGVTAGVRRLEAFDDQALVFGLRVPLPLFDRNQGGILEAEASADRASANRAAAENRLRATLFGLHQELVHAGHALDMLEKEILPNAVRSLDAISRGYEQGAFSSLDLLDASRTATEVRRERVEIAESYETLRIEIARLTGAPPNGAPEENVR
jgi:outer membrane protein, heavy metal efflux system